MTTMTAADQVGERPATHEELAAMVVSSYVSHNTISKGELPNLYRDVLRAISHNETSEEPEAVSVDRPTASQIRKSITPDALISFIDGKPYKTLKRHLTKHNLDPVSYRERYGLPGDYPIVAPTYSERRSALAKQIGLGSTQRSAE